MSEKIERTFFESARRFFQPLFHCKRETFTVFLEYSSWSVLLFISVAFIGRITKSLQSGNIENYYATLVLFSIIFGISIFSSLLLRNYGWVRFFESIQKYLNHIYIQKYVHSENNAIEKIGTGRLMYIIQSGIDTQTRMLNELLYNFITFVPFFVFVLYFLFSESFFIGNIGVLLYILVTFFIVYIDKKQVITRNKKYVFKKNIARIYAKIFMSRFEILQSQQVNQELAKINENLDHIVSNNRKQNFWSMILFRGIDLFIFISKISILIWMFFLFQEGKIQLDYFVTFLALIVYIEKVVLEFLFFYKDFTKQIQDITGLWDFFDNTPEITGYETGNSFTYQTGNIELKNLSYGYEGNKNVFENFDLKITGGKVTSFVGPSGGGKSTLVKLIAGYLKANSGDILIDGQKLSETSLKSYYQDVGYLTQEPSVFDGTVRENLMYAISLPTSALTLTLSQGEREQTASEIHLQPHLLPLGEELGGGQSGGENGMRAENEISQNFDYHLQKILKLSRCEFIYDLPNGLETEIGERGVKLSGGQKQRLAIAKIFLKNPKIIILDEPTSALDSQSEKAITQAMHELFKDRTVLVIAHRLQTVKHADEIIVIDSGKIIERGNHQTLVAKKGYYAEMLELQSGF